MNRYLTNELARLDLLLHREVLRLRATYQLSLDEFRGLYVSDEQVDAYLAHRAPAAEGLTIDRLTARAAEMRRENLAGRTDADPWSRLARGWDLSEFEEGVVLLAAALDYDSKYEPIYAYLNNDVARKWPTNDLALRLLAPDGVAAVRDYLRDGAALFRDGILLRVGSAAEQRSWLTAGFVLSPIVRDVLLGAARPTFPDPGALLVASPRADWDELLLPSAQLAQLRNLPTVLFSPTEDACPPLVVLLGRPGAGRRQVVHATCHALAVPLLELDLSYACRAGVELEQLGRSFALFRRLHRAAVTLDIREADFPPPATQPHLRAFLDQISGSRYPTFLCMQDLTPWRPLLQRRTHLLIELDDPDCCQRRAAWQGALAPYEATVASRQLDAIAELFTLNAGEIEDAVSLAHCASRLDGGAHGRITEQRLFEAARLRSKQDLGQLAQCIRAHHDWESLVLPDATLRRLRSVAAAIANRHRVYAVWGFGPHLASSLGLKVLFSGPSGTGKTMAAGIIGRGLGLEVFKIDLSGVVSKYIGETEKNLDRIFDAARNSNAILFFDEADAIFGKRSEVKDAHDRYANIEIGYLLQKLEDHDGVVILASNLSANIDDAFSRRMHYVIEFPLPDAALRERLWRGQFPREAPLASDVDFEFLAQQFELPGGDIRNVALDAAFLAAENGQVIHMAQIIQALARQIAKQGKVRSPALFREYYPLIGPGT